MGFLELNRGTLNLGNPHLLIGSGKEVYYILPGYWGLLQPTTYIGETYQPSMLRWDMAIFNDQIALSGYCYNTMTGWWFGTSILFSHILGIIIPID